MLRLSALTVAGCLVVSFPIQALAGTPPANVADATKKLESVRAALTAAVAKIQVDPPANADLDAALVAVDALKDTLADGAPFETQDLDYARLVLTARKELRTQREYVEQRRANIAIFDLRRKIDAAVATLDEKAGKVSAKDVAPDDLDAARAAAAAVKKLLGEGKAFTKQDPKFATFVTETEAKATQKEKAIDDRWVQLSADKQKGQLEDSRKALAAALGDLESGFADAKFEAADKAVAALAKQVEQGKPLEDREKAYKAEADKARAELTQARAKMDDAVASAGVSRVKTELDPANESLVASAKALRAKKPTPEQLTEAKTAAFVARKLVDKYDPQGARSPAIAKYLDGVKKTLVEVEQNLQLRSLDVARADLSAALKNLEKRLPSDEEFAEAKAALLVLDKTADAAPGKDPSLAAAVADARWASKEAKATLEKRRYQVDLTRQHDAVETARKAAQALVTELQKAKATEAQFAEAEAAVKNVAAVLEAGKAFVKLDRDYGAFDVDTKARITDLNDKIARRRVVLTAVDARALLAEMVATAKGRIEAARAASATDADVTEAQKSLEAIDKALEARAALEKQDFGYGAGAEKTRNELYKLLDALEGARQARGLRAATGDALMAATAAIEAAANVDVSRKQKDLYDSAAQKLKTCKDEGPKLLEDNPKLGSIDVLVGGAPMKPAEVIAQCTTKAEGMPELQKQAVARVRFDDGPRKTYEAAVALLSAGKKSEALAQFNECFAFASIEKQRFPEYLERKYAAGGTTFTLPELQQACDQQRKALKGK
ncbi:MAG: hypothetical protein K1X89_14660 [Myxococcaceae bacterium]|nr:hypothetical protein [Myxococcaceae bacterium]